MVSFTDQAGVLQFPLGTIISMRFEGFWFRGIEFGFAFALLLPIGGLFRKVGLNDIDLRGLTRIQRGGKSRIIGRIRLLLPIIGLPRSLGNRTNNTVHRRGIRCFRGSWPWSNSQDII